MKKYLLEIDEEQAKVLVRACDLLSRVHGGQLDTIVHVLLTGGGCANGGCTIDHLTPIQINTLQDTLGSLRPLLPQQAIMSPKISDEARTAYDLQQVIRHRLAWDNNPDGGATVDFNTPMQTDVSKRWDEDSQVAVSKTLATIRTKAEER